MSETREQIEAVYRECHADPRYPHETMDAACALVVRLRTDLASLNADTRRALRDRIREEVLSYADSGEESAYRAASEFEHDGEPLFPDFWETDTSEYTYGFTWACFAIVWAIQQYDAHAARPTGEEALAPCR